MMKFSLFIFTALAGIGAATAQDAVKLRAGEHPDFSRVVIPELDRQWSVSTKGKTVEIAFDGEGPAFDLSDLTDKQKAHRVASASVSQRGDQRILSLVLNCDCSVRTSQIAGKGVIIDVLGKSSATKMTQPPAPQAAAENKPAASAEAAAQEPAQSAVIAATPTHTPETLAAARDRMIALLAEASARGVVQIRPTSDEQAKIEAAAAATPANASPPAVATPAAAPLEPPVDPAPCVDPAIFGDRPQESRDYAKIVELREDMEEAIGEERIPAARRLSGAYLRVGFFEEAGAVALSLQDKEDGELMLTAALAELAGATKADALNTFRRYAACGPTFEVLIAAASAETSDMNKASLTATQFAALNALMRSMRGPVAEKLALNALDHNQLELTSRYYDIAVRARAPEGSQALSIIETALQNRDNGPIVLAEPLVEIAQTPGPMQARALGEIAAQYERDAAAAYDGFIEDLSAQASDKRTGPGDVRASFAGARALASSGRITGSINLLSNVAAVSDRARTPAKILARSIIIDALAGDNDAQRLLAVNAYIQHASLLHESGKDADELSIAIARELAALGATELTDQIATMAGSNAASAEIGAIRALARLNAGADAVALTYAENHETSREAATLAARAGLRLDDKTAVANAVKQAMKLKYMDAETAAAAFAAGEWRLAADAYAALDPDNAADAEKLALAALMAGAKTMPEAAKRALTEDPETLETLKHMFASAPRFSISNLDRAAAYTAGVSSETARIRERLNDD